MWPLQCTHGFAKICPYLPFFWQRLKPAVIIPKYDILKSISYDICLGQDLNLGQDLGKNLHPPNISWIHDVNKICLLDLTK